MLRTHIKAVVAGAIIWAVAMLGDVTSANAFWHHRGWGSSGGSGGGYSGGYYSGGYYSGYGSTIINSAPIQGGTIVPQATPAPTPAPANLPACPSVTPPAPGTSLTPPLLPPGTSDPLEGAKPKN